MVSQFGIYLVPVIGAGVAVLVFVAVKLWALRSASRDARKRASLSEQWMKARRGKLSIGEVESAWK